jgi:anti-anti-sigma factor
MGMTAMDDLIVEQQIQNDVGIVRADGIIDLATMRPMREAVRGVMADGVKHVVLDLRKVSYMDSAGISIIMTAKRGTSDKGGEVFVAVRPGEVERALHLVQMERVVRFVDNPEQAVSDLNQPATP